MDRKFLTAVLVIGLVATLAGAGIYAVFTDKATSTGSFAAGILDISAGTGSWSAGFDNMKPGDTVTFTIIVQNDGTLPLEYTITTVLTGELITLGSNPCGVSAIRVDTAAYTPPESLSVAGGGDWKDTVEIDITMPSAAGNTYQGKSGLLTVTFDAES